MNGQFQFSKDREEGVKWLRQAAADNCFKAQGTLGIKLIKGVDMPRDVQAGVNWFRRGAEYGDAECQGDLGYALETGETGTPDLIEACLWDQLAANQGISQAKVNLARVHLRMSDSQLQAAAQRVEQFEPKPLRDVDVFKR